MYNDCYYWYITDVVTAASHRRQGIAAQLMKEVEHYAEENIEAKFTDNFGNLAENIVNSSIFNKEKRIDVIVEMWLLSM